VVVPPPRTPNRKARVTILLTVISLILLWGAVFVAGLPVLLAMLATGGCGFMAWKWLRSPAPYIQPVELPEGVTKRPRRLGPHLLAHERVVWEGRQHPVSVMHWWGLIALTQVVSVMAAAYTGNGMVFAVLWLAGTGLGGWQILNWWHDWIAITNWRIIQVRGIFAMQILIMPISQLVNLTIRIPLESRILAFWGATPFGTLDLETAAQIESIPRLSYLPEIGDISKRLQGMFTLGDAYGPYRRTPNDRPYMPPDPEDEMPPLL